ncbi:trypsin-like serine protease [Vibrio gangliei]|uniref:trypsin-like serine protease n=1 Tax=Vibrio gangliei TaxID=2077090 RepID=UPI000D014F79|nr:trypsin-like serine protease [Vibrio gangliei]
MKKLTTSVTLLSALVSANVFAVDTSLVYHNVDRVDQDNIVIANSDSSAYCTGTVIGGKWVITAAHCNQGSSVDGVYQTLSVKKSNIPTEYTEYKAQTENPDSTGYSSPMLDVAVWELDDALKHSTFAPISNVTLSDNDLLRLYGFGQTNPELNYIEQRTLANWHYGNWDLANTPNVEACTIDGATHDDGYCETLDPNMMVTYEINQGRIIDGDSGAALFKDGYMVGILHSLSPYGLQDAGHSYHADSGTTEGVNVSDIVSSDADLDSMNGSYANRMDYAATQNFLLDNINAWNYASWVKVNSSNAVTVKIQSLHNSTVNLLNTITTTGDADVDTSTIACFSPEHDNNTAEHHSADSVQPFDVCSLSVTSNGGEGQILLGDNQVIHVNKWDVDSVDPEEPDNGGESSGGSSGGSLGVFGLLGLLGLGIARRRK